MPRHQNKKIGMKPAANGAPIQVPVYACPYNLTALTQMAQLGLSQREICIKLNVPEGTWYEHKAKFPEIDKAINAGTINAVWNALVVVDENIVTKKNFKAALAVLKKRSDLFREQPTEVLHSGVIKNDHNVSGTLNVDGTIDVAVRRVFDGPTAVRIAEVILDLEADKQGERAENDQ